MTSILFVIGKIYLKQLKCTYLKKKKLFLIFFHYLLNFDQILNTIFKKMTLIAHVFLKIEAAKVVVS